MKHFFPLILLSFLLLNCSSDADSSVDIPSDTMYFPPLSGNIWETKPMNELGWNESQVQPLLTFLEEKHTKGFIVLVNGRIVMENYFNGHTATSPWYWASAGKTLTTATVGIAQKEGLLDSDDKVSDYLGTGWTSAPLVKENLITNRHLLTMTSGLNETLGDDVSPANLQYVADAGSRWAYHNVYVKLQDVVAEASNQTWNSYFNNKLRDKIGMSGTWIPLGGLSVYWSTTRSVARFGLLSLNKGKWENEVIIPETYMTNTISTSQNLNKAYGYMWWLNGKESYRLPQTQFQFSGCLIPSAPTDMVSGLGKNDQKIYVIPSKKMVVIRLGEVADEENFALSDFDNQLWQKINAVIN
ncbi:serine hydrolase domain-containing protein [Flavobacterium sp. UBA6135]|uniref:serine hydrolase domain-containing protein n=1 Tax=Flavobacterium sp. UBA6135 TaxID=1946553 RepID=UPI0025BE7ADF|nr:serine hydrolase [Flavobacterium sp. UBA6135]